MNDNRIETERLILCETEPDDKTKLVNMFGNQTVMKWLFGTGPMTSKAAEQFIKEYFTFGRSPSGLGVLRVKESNDFAGFAGLLPCRYLYEDDYELGFALMPEHWGKGYATEVGKAQITYGFDEFNVRRLLGLAHPQNTASLNALEKIGMKPLKLINTDQRGPRCVYVVRRTE